jgi:hypothetical protein
LVESTLTLNGTVRWAWVSVSESLLPGELERSKCEPASAGGRMKSIGLNWKAMRSKNVSEEIFVNDVTDRTTGLPLTFPNPVWEARRRAQEFGRLSPDDRWRQIAELAEIGMNLVQRSPRREEIERRMEAQEAEWKRLQQKVFNQHGG